MSATQRLKAQLTATPAQHVNTLNFGLRSQLKTGLQKSGKFSDVNIKFDGRRGHLNLTIRGTGHRDIHVIQRAAAAANLLMSGHVVTQNYSDTTYRVTVLSEIKPTATAAPVAKPVAKPASKLTTAVKAEQAIPAPIPTMNVYFGYDLVGKVDGSLAKQIRQMIEAANKPKFADVVVVDLKTSAKVTVTVPYDVAQAVKAQVPSFNQGAWSIKSTHGISILKENANTVTEKTWVIA